MSTKALRRRRGFRCLLVLIVGLAACSDGSAPAARRTGDADLTFTTSGVVPVRGFPAHEGAAVAWTARDLFVFGGFRNVGDSDRRDLLDDGALIDVETGRAVPLPPAPFADPVLYPAAVRSGDSVSVAGIECSDYLVFEDSASDWCASGSGRFGFASFDLASQSWSPVARIPELDALRSGQTSTRGRSMVRFGIVQLLGTESGRTVIVTNAGGDSTNRFWLHEPARATLTRLPGTTVNSNVCATGNRVAVVTTRLSGGPTTDMTLRLLDVAASRPVWTDTPATTVSVTLAPDLACLGEHLMVTHRYGNTDGRIYDLTSQTWSDVAPLPPPETVTAPDGRTYSVPFSSSLEQQVWTGTELLMLTDWANPITSTPPPGRAYDPATNTWRALTPLPFPMARPLWAAPVVVAYDTRGSRSRVQHYLPD